MSDQDEISRLLAEARAQTEAEPDRNMAADTPVAEPKSAPAPQIVRKHPPRLMGRNNEVLGLAWLHGSLHAAVFHRQKMTHSWSCPTTVRTVADFEAVIDDALAQLGFAGTETFLVLEHEVFAHHADNLPAFTDGVLRNYFKSRIQRHEQEHGRVLWVTQPLAATGKEQSVLLHLLPRSFYDELHRVLLKRHLDLTRILPFVVPLQHELNRIPADKNTTVMVAAEIGASTAIVAGRVGGPLLFTRTVLADLNREPGRVGVEVNRSLLYTKQHFESAAGSIWLMAENGAPAAAELEAKCGSSRKIVTLPTTPVDWLQATIKLSPQQPVNLLAGYLRTKRRSRLVRATLLAASWIGLALMVFTGLKNADAWRREQSRIASLRTREASLRAEKEHLIERNRSVERDRAFIDQVLNERLRPVPARLLAFLASVLPDGVRTTEFEVRWEPETANWSFRIDGMIQGDEETARGIIAELQTRLSKSPLRPRFTDGGRALFPAPSANRASADEIQRFSLEGTLLEK